LKILFFLTNPNNLLILNNLLKHQCEVDVIIPESSPTLKVVKDATAGYKNCYVASDIEKTADQLFSKKIYDFIFPAFGDRSISIIAKINDKHNLKGLHSSSAKFIKNKKKYYRLWQQLNIPCPQVWQTVKSGGTVNQLSPKVIFPCIVKPSVGHASIGIQIIENKNDLIDFFADTDEQIHSYQEKHGDRYKKLQYFSGSDDYVIQEYIKGDVVSFIGYVYNNQIVIDFIFDIETQAYPYVPETGLKYPSKYSEDYLRSNSIKYLEKFFKKINLNNTAFMLDVIIDEYSQLNFIDFSPRLSVSHKLLWHSGEKNYAYKLTKKLLYGEDYQLETKKAVLFRQLPVEKKKIKSIEMKEKELADVVSLPKGEIQLQRNDLSVYHNGYAIFTGKDLIEVEEKYQKFVTGFKITYSN
jgi:hypothetical protein